MSISGHMTHKILPIISDDDHKRHHVIEKNSPRALEDSPLLDQPLSHPMDVSSSRLKRHPPSPTKSSFSIPKHPLSKNTDFHCIESDLSYPVTYDETSQLRHSINPNFSEGKTTEMRKNEIVLRKLQPTSPPKFLLSYVPKVISQPAGFYTCDRSAAYKAREMKRSSSDLHNNLVLYGALDYEYLEQRKHHFFPQTLGGFIGMDPQGGWSHIQIPGIVKCTNTGGVEVLYTRLLL